MEQSNEEIWKDVPNYEGIYQASTLGRVKSLKRIIIAKDRNIMQPEKILKLSLAGDYYHVALCVNSKAKTKRVHRIIADTFIPNPENKSQINHKDGNKLNNAVSNLERATSSENIQHSYTALGRTSPMKGLYGDAHPTSLKRMGKRKDKAKYCPLPKPQITS